jgi:hypothetical protein
MIKLPVSLFGNLFSPEVMEAVQSRGDLSGEMMYVTLEEHQQIVSKLPPPPPALGLGDMVAAALDTVGITKERVSALVGGDCGCQQRQDALNELGRKIGIG